MVKKSKRVLCALAAVLVLFAVLAVPVFADSSTTTSNPLDYTAFPGATLRGKIGDNTILVQDFGTGWNASAQTTSRNSEYSWVRQSAYAGGPHGNHNFASTIKFSTSAPLSDWRITLDYVPPAYSYNNGVWMLDDPNNLLAARLDITTQIPKNSPAPLSLHFKGAYRRYVSYANGSTFEPEYVEYDFPYAYDAKQGSNYWMYSIPLADVIVGINNQHESDISTVPIDKGYRSSLWDLSLIPYCLQNSEQTAPPTLYTINFRTNSGDAHPVGTWHYYALLTDEKSYRPTLETVSLENVSPVNWIGNVISGFFSLELFPGFSIGVIFLAVLAFLLILAVVRLFAGG